MKVEKGELIKEVETGKVLVVEQDFDRSKDEKVSTVFDFLATYTHPIGNNAFGQVMYSNRGFSFEDEGTIWERVQATMY